jgi:hypothetical protein
VVPDIATLIRATLALLERKEANIRSRLSFWITYPFVMAAFKWRSHREWRQIVPRRWLSPTAVIAEDLELFEPRERFDLKFIDDFAKARDDIMSLTKKQIIVSVLIFLFLLSNYLAIGLDVSLGGFSLRYSPGIAEGLLLVSNMLSCYTLFLQANSSILDATIKSAIKFGVPEELRTLYLVRYFPHEQFGRYQPFNMPYLIPTKLQRTLTQAVAVLLLILLVFTLFAFATCNLFLLIHHLWIKPSFGVWSNVLLVYIFLLGVSATIYLVLTRARLPYLDYTVNGELELLQQMNPERHRTRLQEIYGRLNEDRRNMERRGYLNPTPRSD